MRMIMSTLWALGALCLASFSTAAWADDTYMSKTSPHDVATTVDNLVAAIEKSPAKLFARIDHAAGAKEAGLDLEPTTLVIFGNPKVGTPIMQADRMAGIDLPVRVLVWSKDGATTMTALSASGMSARHGVDGAGEALQKMAGAIGKLMDAAAK